MLSSGVVLDSASENLLLIVFPAQLIANALQCCPALVADRLVAVAALTRAIRSTFRTKTKTVLVTERLHRNRELNLFESQIAQRNAAIEVKLDVELFLASDLDFFVFLSRNFRTRPESYVKL